MKRIILLLSLLLAWLHSTAQDTIITSPPLKPDGVHWGVTFEFEVNTPVQILGLENIFSSVTTTADLWMRVGGVNHAVGSPPYISSATGWTKVIAAATINGADDTSKVLMNFNGKKLAIPENTRYGFYIAGASRFKTGTSADSTTFSDGIGTIDVSDSAAYAGSFPSLTSISRRFLGSVIYETDIKGNCVRFSNFLIDSIDSTTAQVNWTPGAGNNSLYLEYGPEGFTPGSGSIISGTHPGAQPPVNLTGLTANTSYDLYFGEFCNGGTDTTRFLLPKKFTTEKLCATPTGLAITSALTSTTIDLNWSYAGIASSFDVIYGPVGFDPTSAGSSVTIMGNAPYTLTGLNPSTAYDLYLVAHCGMNKGYIDTIGPISYQTQCAPLAMPFYESFDNWPVSCWDSTSGTANWDEYYASSGDNWARANSWNSGNIWVIDRKWILRTPPINISQDAELSFTWSKRGGNSIGPQRFIVRSTAVGSGIWDTIMDIDDPTILTDPSAGYNSPGNGYLEEFRLNPIAYTGKDALVEFIYHSGYSNTLFLNDINIKPAPTCPKLGDLRASVQDTFATLVWDDTSSYTEYKVWFGPKGFYNGPTTTGYHKVLTTADSLEIDTLRASTCYEYLVRGICSPGDSSDWIGPFQFCTACRPFTMPYYQSYNNWPLPCWDIDLGNSSWGQSFWSPGWAQAEFYWSTPGDELIMNSPPILIDEAAQVRYNWLHYGTTNSNDQLVVRISILGSGVWDTLVDRKSSKGNFNSSTAPGYNPYTGAEDIWIIDTNIYLGEHVVVQFHATSGGGSDVLINDFWVEKVTTCPRPTGLHVNNVTAFTADLSWTPGSAGNSNF